MLLCQKKSRTRSQFWQFLISKKAQAPTMRITEQPILLTKCTINRQSCKFLSTFAKSGQSNRVVVLVLESKGP